MFRRLHEHRDIMAERRRFLSSDYRKKAASDAVYDHECDACRFEGTISEGTSFCNVCREFLCDECKRVHRRSRATRDHDLVDGDSLHKVQSQGQPQYFELCLKHPGKVVSFFCAAHDSVFCADCKVLTHGGCRNVTSVSAASTLFQSSREADKFLEKIQSMNARIKDLFDERNENAFQIDKHKHKLLKEITDIRDEIDTLSDTLEKEMRQTVISTVAKETSKIQDDISSLNTIKSSLGDDLRILDAARATGNNEKIFLAMKRVDLQALEAPLGAFGKERYIIKMDFKPHHLLQVREFLSSVQRFSSLDIKLIKRPENILPGSLRDRALVEVTERDIEPQDGKNPCSINGSIFLPNGESLICDFDKNKLKLLSVEIKVQAEKNVTSPPWGVAMVTEQEVIISLPDEKKLQYVTVPGLKPGRKVKIGKRCYGLAIHKDQIFVTCHDDLGEGEVLVLTKNGTIQRRIGRTGDGNYRFSSPYYIAVDALGEKIYVSDWDQHSVTCLTVKGEPVYHCVLEGAVSARGLLVDSEGGVFVGSRDSSTASLQFLNPEGNHYRTLKTWARKRWNPHSFCYRSRDRTLLVGMWRNTKMLVYRFE